MKKPQSLLAASLPLPWIFSTLDAREADCQTRPSYGLDWQTNGARRVVVEWEPFSGAIPRVVTAVSPSIDIEEAALSRPEVADLSMTSSGAVMDSAVLLWLTQDPPGSTFVFRFGLTLGQPRALSRKECWLRKERRRSQQREWVCNRRKAAVASTSTASRASDSLAKEEDIARLESRRREQNQRCERRRWANATDNDRATETKRKREARRRQHSTVSTPAEQFPGATAMFRREFVDYPFGITGAVCDRLWFTGDVSTIGGVSDEKKGETGACALRQCIEYSSAGLPSSRELKG
ncbi:hypothetical protein ISCGN_027441 [Ixodes scapularis]